MIKNTSIPLLIALLSLFAVGCTQAPREPSATDNVQVLPVSFWMDGLERERQVRLYLPPNYANSGKKYPVLYMHDAQNLFDDATSYAGEWGVDESLNELARTKGLEIIVVGIDNGGDKRMNELSPWPNKRFGEAEGKQYMGFITEVVKPYIDTNFRTMSAREHTAIMGSSMGGLISHYAIHEHATVFSKAGIFSPSYWYSQTVFEYTREQQVPRDARLYVMLGSEEGDGMVADADRMQRQLKVQGHPRENTLFKTVLGGQHSEAFWRNEFPEAIQWLFR
jgi:predicted alpha/beta superfamily hydrolase